VARARSFARTYDGDTIPGEITHVEGVLLYNLARQAPKGGVIVEIGSYLGKSTVFLAQGSKDGSQLPVYAIDPHVFGTKNQFMKNLENTGMAEIVIPLCVESVVAAPSIKSNIALLFIDGLHSLTGCMADVGLYFPKVLNGGVIAMHDTLGGWPCSLVSDVALYRNQRIDVKGLTGGITYGVKTNPKIAPSRQVLKQLLFLKKWCLWHLYVLKNQPDLTTMVDPE
jgi:predicted O-methyltransferase YrrM